MEDRYELKWKKYGELSVFDTIRSVPVLEIYINEKVGKAKTMSDRFSIMMVVQNEADDIERELELIAVKSEKKHLNGFLYVFTDPKTAIEYTSKVFSNKIAKRLNREFEDDYRTDKFPGRDLNFCFAYNIYGKLGIKPRFWISVTDDIEQLVAKKAVSDRFIIEKDAIDSIDTTLLNLPNKDERVRQFINEHFSEAGKLYYVTCGGAL